MHQRMQHLNFACKSYEGSKFFGGRYFKINSSTSIHISFGDVHIVVIAVLGMV